MFNNLSYMILTMDGFSRQSVEFPDLTYLACSCIPVCTLTIPTVLEYEVVTTLHIHPNIGVRLTRCISS